jgi:hypothetical protein
MLYYPAIYSRSGVFRRTGAARLTLHSLCAFSL